MIPERLKFGLWRLSRYRFFLPPVTPVMKSKLIMKILLTPLLALPLSGCLTQRTVTEGGHTVKQEYVIKRPLKEAIQNSQ